MVPLWRRYREVGSKEKRGEKMWMRRERV